MNPSLMSNITMTNQTPDRAPRKRSHSEKLVRSASPLPRFNLETLTRKPSSASTSSFFLHHLDPHHDHQHDHDHEHDHSQLASSISSSTKKPTGSNHFIRMARQASDSAFRTVGLSRKASNNALHSLKKNLSHSSEDESTEVVYEQNPRTYLFQHDPHPSPNSFRPHRPHPDDTVVDRSPKALHSRTLGFDLRKNVSMPDMKAAYAADTWTPSRNGSRTLLPSRPRVHQHHFVSATTFNEPLQSCPSSLSTVMTLNNSSEHSLFYSSQLDSVPEKQPLNTIPFPQDHDRDQEQENALDQEDQEQPSQSRKHHRSRSLHVRRQRLNSGNDSILSCSSPQKEKDLPPTPQDPASPSQIVSAALALQDSHHPDPLLQPMQLSPSDLSSRKRSGIIPQDVLRTMDPKTLQKETTSTLVASRVYKVLDNDQKDDLRKEQDELQKYIESMNAALHIESRIRDASQSLAHLHDSNANGGAFHAAAGQLSASTQKMDQMVQLIQQAFWRMMAVQKILLQHEGAILNAGMRRLDAENRDLSRANLQLKKAHQPIHIDALTSEDASKDSKVRSSSPNSRDPPEPNPPQVQQQQEHVHSLQSRSWSLPAQPVLSSRHPGRKLLKASSLSSSSLHAVLNSSLVELDRQISLGESAASRPSSTSTVSSGATAVSFDSSDPCQEIKTEKPILSEAETLAKAMEDDAVIEGAMEEIRRLNALVGQLEQDVWSKC